MSNKTDFQALNTDYAALIENLRGKAVGGGGGGYEVVTGSFSSLTTANKFPVTVEGIGFRPKLVIVFFNGSKRISTSGTVKYCLSALAFDENGNTFCSYFTDSTSSPYIYTTSKFTGSITGDGFVLTSSGSSYIMAQGNYRYLCVK